MLDNLERSQDSELHSVSFPSLVRSPVATLYPL
jgi:hypothetical protein